MTTATQPTVSRFALRNVFLLKLLSLKPDCFWYVSSCSLKVISALAAMLSGCLGLWQFPHLKMTLTVVSIRLAEQPIRLDVNLICKPGSGNWESKDAEAEHKYTSINENTAS